MRKYFYLSLFLTSFFVACTLLITLQPLFDINTWRKAYLNHIAYQLTGESFDFRGISLNNGKLVIEEARPEREASSYSLLSTVPFSWEKYHSIEIKTLQFNESNYALSTTLTPKKKGGWHVNLFALPSSGSELYLEGDLRFHKGILSLDLLLGTPLAPSLKILAHLKTPKNQSSPIDVQGKIWTVSDLILPFGTISILEQPFQATIAWGEKTPTLKISLSNLQLYLEAISAYPFELNHIQAILKDEEIHINHAEGTLSGLPLTLNAILKNPESQLTIEKIEGSLNGVKELLAEIYPLDNRFLNNVKGHFLLEKPIVFKKKSNQAVELPQEIVVNINGSYYGTEIHFDKFEGTLTTLPQKVFLPFLTRPLKLTFLNFLKKHFRSIYNPLCLH
jgi:hypothetical protein